MMQRIGFTSWIVPIRSLAFAVLVGLFCLVAISVVGLHLSEGFDRFVLDGFSQIQNAALDGLMIALTVSGDLTTTFLVGIVLTILRRTRRLGLTILINIVVISVLLMY
jgi:undecaprenyl-diphosphatase